MKCRLISTGHEGRIGRETDTHYGIYWLDGIDGDEHALRTQKYGLPFYWQLKELIELIHEKES